MIYLSGAVKLSLLTRSDVGLMLTPNMGNAPDLSRTWWAADTGCYSAAASRTFDPDRYLAWLSKRLCHQTCLFATAPDVVGDAHRTYQRSRDILPQIRALGFQAALVAQDGIEEMHIDWATFDCLFIGGTDRFHLSDAARELVREASWRDKWTHLGRVNSGRRLRIAADWGCDSADGTYIKFGPDRNTGHVLAWLAHLQRQPSMGLL